MFLAPDGTKPLDFTLGSVFGCGIQPNAQQENLFLNRLLYLAATGYGLRKRSLNPADELVNTAVTLSAKRPRVEVIPTPTACILPSRVLHVRNLPADTTEIDIVKLAMPFGPIANLVLTKKTGQALIEMTSVDVAAKMLEYYQFYPPFFHGSEESAILQFSKYQNLELTGISRPVSEAIAMANEHFLRCVAENPTRPRVLRVFLEPAPHNHLNYMDYFKGVVSEQCNSSPLLVIFNGSHRNAFIENELSRNKLLRYPGLKIFYRYGAVLRIIVFKMSGRSQAFVEFHSPISAHVALLAMNGQVLPAYSATMRIEFSRQTSLELRQDDNTSRDFVVQPLSPQEEQDLIKSLTPTL